MKKQITILIAMLLSVCILSGCSENTESKPFSMDDVKKQINSSSAEDFTETSDTTDYICFTVKDHGRSLYTCAPRSHPSPLKICKNS